MISEHELRAVALDFANALDRCDFEAARAVLSSTCRYDLTNSSSSDEGTLVGPAAIVESYQFHDARARALFDSVEYFSGIEAVDGSTAVIRFSDVLEKNGERHTYSCRQHIHINESCQIDMIDQEDIPREQAEVRLFMDRVGVTL